jgi:fatty-acyl-CoA synthase
MDRVNAATLEPVTHPIPTFAHAIDALAGDQEGGFTFLGVEGGERRLSFDALGAEARQGARRLVGAGLRPGERLALIIPEADTFVLSFLAALRAGIVPVPLYPPVAFGKLDSYIAATARILRAARVGTLLTTRKAASLLWSLVDRVEGLERLLTVEALEDVTPGATIAPGSIRPDDIAFLQFTSGSTAAPKGVVVTHRSLLANCRAVAIDTLRMDGRDVAVSWLPMYHDLGLIGCVLATARHHLPTVFIPPARDRSPKSW